MRVIAGTARGTRLAAPRGMATRPTADRVREALFNIIQSRYDLEGATVLDLCAGTGGLGIEALSRGAATCCFVEKDREAQKCLRRNLETTRLTGRALLLEMDLFRALPWLAAQGRRFSLVFFDPPYAAGLYGAVLRELSSRELLEPEGVVIAESSTRTVLPEREGDLVRRDRRIYGDTALEWYVVGEE